MTILVNDSDALTQKETDQETSFRTSEPQSMLQLSGMIRILFFLTLAASMPASVTAQYNRKYMDDSVDMRKTQQMLITLDSTKRSSLTTHLPVNRILVGDIRFDTTRIGTYSVPSFFMVRVVRNFKLNLQGSAGGGIQKYLNRYYQKSLEGNDGEIVCFLKKLRLNRRDTITESKSAAKTMGQISFQTEVFLRSGGQYYAAFKIDTVIVATIGIGKNDITDEIRSNLLLPAIAHLQSRLEQFDWTRIKEKKAFDESLVIDNYYKKRFDLPILREPYKKGVYLSLGEFVQNQPSIPVYSVKRDAGGVALFDEKGNFINTLNVFGYSNGSRCWIQSGNASFPLIRNGNSFEYYYTFFADYKFLQAIDLERGVSTK